MNDIIEIIVIVVSSNKASEAGGILLSVIVSCMSTVE